MSATLRRPASAPWRRAAASLALITAAAVHTSSQQPNDAISGTVVNEAGRPVVGALVVAVPSPSDRSHSARTDSAGAFRIVGLSSGKYYVSVPVWTRTIPIPPTLGVTPAIFEAAPATIVDSDGAHVLMITGPSTVTSANAHQRMYVTTYAGGALRPSDMTPIDAGSADVTITLTRQPTVRIAGVLSSGASGPVKRAAVRLYLDRRELESDPVPTATSFTDGNGHFLFMAVAPGPYIVDVDRPAPPGDDLRLSATGFPAMVPRDYSAGSDLREYLPPTTLIVGAHDKSDVALTLRRGALVTGTVIVDRPMAQSDGQLIPQFYITLGGLSTPVIPEGRHPFLIPDIKPGRYRLRAGPLLEGFSIISAMLDGRDVKSAAIDIGWSGLSGLTITIGGGHSPR